MALNINGTTGISGVDGSASAPALQGTDSNTGINFGSDTVNINTGGTTRATVDSAGALDVPSDFPIKVGGSEKLRITSSGNIGVSTTSPVAQTDAGSNALTPVLDLKGTGSLNNSSGVLQLTRKDDATQGSMIYNSGEDAGLTMRNTDGNGMGFYNGTTLALRIDASGDLRVQRVYSNNTSGGANVRVQSDGLLQRDTSSRRYKNTITDATHGLADLNKLRSVTYKGNNDGDTIFGGLIAEEVHDAGLTEFVDYDSDNQPDALKYGNMVSLCIKAIQELSAKVETLETKVAALEAG